MPLCSTITAAKSPVIAPVRSAPPSSASYSGHDRINADEAAHAFYADRHTSRSKKAGHVIPKRIKFCLFWKGARLGSTRSRRLGHWAITPERADFQFPFQH